MNELIEMCVRTMCKGVVDVDRLDETIYHVSEEYQEFIILMGT